MLHRFGDSSLTSAITKAKVTSMLNSDRLDMSSVAVWGKLLSVLRSAAERSDLQAVVDEESFCRHPREDAPLLLETLAAQKALTDDDSFIAKALMDSTEPGEDYGSRYEPLSEADQETVRRVSYRFDARLLGLERAAQLLGVSEQRALQYINDGAIESFTFGDETRVLERSVRAYLQNQTRTAGRSYSRYPSRYN